jgi:septum formation protein
MLVLASGSPRRRELLARLGVLYDVVPSQVEEREPRPGEDPSDYALTLAQQKVDAVARVRPDDVVLAADTVVALDGHILGKPVDEADAWRILRLLRGKRHIVFTGVAVRCGETEKMGIVAATVSMRDFSDTDAQRYVATGEPMDKAGAYAVQGKGGRLVEEVDGCYNAVVGLPLCLTATLLRACGITTRDDASDRCSGASSEPSFWLQC